MEGYTRQRRPRQIRPLFVIGFEGPTEWNYAESIVQYHNMSCKRAGKPDNRHDALLATTIKTAAKEHRSAPNRPVIPIIVIDIEVMSNENIAAMQTFIDTARNQGVYVFVNRPKIEHWFLQHFQTASENMSSAEVDSRLARHLQIHNLPKYSKPGSQSFYMTLVQTSDAAITNCEASNHSSYELPCMCQLIHLIRQFA